MECRASPHCPSAGWCHGDARSRHRPLDGASARGVVVYAGGFPNTRADPSSCRWRRARSACPTRFLLPVVVRDLGRKSHTIGLMYVGGRAQPRRAGGGTTMRHVAAPNDSDASHQHGLISIRLWELSVAAGGRHGGGLRSTGHPSLRPSSGRSRRLGCVAGLASSRSCTGPSCRSARSAGRARRGALERGFSRGRGSVIACAACLL